jgi:tetratricopeptide (TPR) repeat protein
MGRCEESILAMKKALELDPLSSPINAFMIAAYSDARQYEQALEQCRITLELDPAFLVARSQRAGLLARLGRYEEAIEEAQKFRSSMRSLLGIFEAKASSDACTQLRAGVRRPGKSRKNWKARPSPPTLPRHFHISTPLWEIATARFTGWKRLIVRVSVSLSLSVTHQAAMACEAIHASRICYAE